MSVQKLFTTLWGMCSLHRATILILLVPSTLCHAQSWSWNWVRKIGTSGLNDPFCVNPLNPDIVYSSPGNNTIVISRDRGRTWQTLATISGGNQVKALVVSSRDTSVMLVAQETTPPDRIMKTTNRGATWFQTLSGNFYYWGHPLAYEPLLRDEIVYTEASNVLYRSANFGSTWDTVRVNPFSSNNQGWEDAFIRPDSGKILIVSDNANGIWKSVDAGVTWRRVYTAAGEVPAIALNLQNPAIAFGTKFGGGGGLVKTTNYGETWQLIPQFNGKNMWGVAISTENPNYVVTNTWGHSFSTDGGAYISRDGGATWERTYQGFGSSSNHALCILDTMSVFSLQGDGIYKLQFPGRISGEVYHDLNGNGVRDSGETGLRNRRVRLTGARTDSASTSLLGNYEFTLLGAGNYTVIPSLVSQNLFVTSPPSGSYTLTVTDGEQHTGKAFGIAERTLGIVSPNGGERWAIGDTHTIAWTSRFMTGNVRIEISRDGGATFVALFDNTLNDGREMWVVSGPATNAAQIKISSLDYATVTDLSDSAFSIGSPNDVAETRARPQQFALHQNYPNPFNPTTEIRYQTSEVSHVTLNVFDLLGRQVATLVNEVMEPGQYSVVFDAEGLPSGIYCYCLKAGGLAQTRKMLLLR